MATFKLESFSPGVIGSTAANLFQKKLLNAVVAAPAHSVIDCTSYSGDITLTSTIQIKKPLTLLFGNVRLILSVGQSKHMFHILSPNVSIIGADRSTSSASLNAGTIFKMGVSGGGYHVYAANVANTGTTSASGLTLENIDFEGLKSIYTSVSNAVNYTYSGAGGILISEGNPGREGSSINNVSLKNIHVFNVKQHGILMYGAVASRLEKCRVTNVSGHGFYITGLSNSVHIDTCHASSTDLAGFCVDDSTHCSLTTCVAENCSLGYWLRKAKAITLNSCGADSSVVSNATLPYNLGISLLNSDSSTVIDDIGADNTGFFKGTNFMITFGEANSLISCHSKDPGNRPGMGTYAHRLTSHFTIAGDSKNNRIAAPFITGTSTVKYEFRLFDINEYLPFFNFLDYYVWSNQTSAPEPDDPSMASSQTLYNQSNSYLITFYD